MSAEKKERVPVPEGQTRYLKTSQMKANDKGYIGYKTEWESFQKEIKYVTPKAP